MSNFMKIRPMGTELFPADRWTDGRQTDTTKLIVALRNFANALKNGKDKTLGRIIAGFRLPLFSAYTTNCDLSAVPNYLKFASRASFILQRLLITDFSDRMVWAFWSLAFFQALRSWFRNLLTYTCMRNVFGCIVLCVYLAMGQPPVK